MAKKPKIDRTFIIKDLETLKVLSDPLRMEILRFISIANQRGRFVTVKELAEELEMPNTKLYYHINLLEKHGLILVGDTQIVSGIIEKQYQVVAEDLAIDKHIIATDEGGDDGQLEEVLDSLSVLVDKAYADLRKSMKIIRQEKLDEKKGGPPARKQLKMHLQSNELFLTERQAEDLKEKLNDLADEYDRLSSKNIQKDSKADYYGYTVIFNPLYHRTPNPNADQPTQGEPKND